DGIVYALALSSDGGALYVGGGFLEYREVNFSARRIAKLSTSDGAIDNMFQPISATGGFGSSVYTIALSSDDAHLYVGGSFLTYQAVDLSARRIAKLSTTDGAIDNTFHP